VEPNPFLRKKEDYNLNKSFFKIVKEDKRFASVLEMKDPVNHNTILEISCSEGDHYSDLFDLLVASGVDLYHMNGSTALHIVVRNGNKPVIEKCLKIMSKGRKCPLTLKDDELQNMLHIAASENNDVIVEYLLEYIKNNKKCPKCTHKYEKDKDGFTPLHLAVNLSTSPKKSKQYIRVTSLLIETNSDVNTQNNVGNTPLHDAYYQKSQEIANLLIDKKADVSIANNYSQKPIIVD